jgi:uncharacterized membrane protein
MSNQNTINKEQKPPAIDKPETDNMLGILCYLGILVLIPYLINQEKQNDFIKYHTKQGIVLAAIGLAVFALRIFLPGGNFIYYGIGLYGVSAGYMLWALLGLIVSAIQFILFVLSIVGIMNVVQGHKKPLPIIGKYANKVNI